jgi:hypothetical protein
MKVPPVSQSNQQVRDLVKEAFQNSIRNLENQSFAEREASPWSVKVYYGPSSKTLTRVVIERQLGSL